MSVSDTDSREHQRKDHEKRKHHHRDRKEKRSSQDYRIRKERRDDRKMSRSRSRDRSRHRQRHHSRSRHRDHSKQRRHESNSNSYYIDPNRIARERRNDVTERLDYGFGDARKRSLSLSPPPTKRRRIDFDCNQSYNHHPNRNNNNHRFDRFEPRRNDMRNDRFSQFRRNRSRNNGSQRRRRRNMNDLMMRPQFDVNGKQIMNIRHYKIKKKQQNIQIDQHPMFKEQEQNTKDSDNDGMDRWQPNIVEKRDDDEQVDAKKDIVKSIKLEADFSEKPLFLVCDNGNTHNDWKVIIRDMDRRSFCGYRPNPFSNDELDKWFDLMTKSGDIDWQRPKLRSGQYLNRKAAWLVARDCRCFYRYSSTKWPPIVFPAWFEEITQRVLNETGLRYQYLPNCCNVNWYEDGRDAVGWHQDDEPLFQSKYDDTLILSLSIGQSRKFEVKLLDRFDNNCEDEMIDVTQIVLHSGDLMSMEGLFQKYYHHRVPKAVGINGARVNFTWRWIKRHYRKDGCGKYTTLGPGRVDLL